ncbi:S26 family signal peptidase [Clostridium ganghwense]
MKTYSTMKVKVSQKYVLVLGDNRIDSVDSRKIGFIPIENIKRHALYRFNIFKFSANKLE